MAFLFGKKKGGHREGTPTGLSASVPGPPQPVNTSVNNLAPEGSGPGSPGAPGQLLPQGVRTHQSQDSIEAATQSPQGPRGLQQSPPTQPPSNAALYPWSQRRLALSSSHTSPFPRYGHAANAVASKDGDVYIMGGLIRSQNVRGDLWMIEGGNERLEAYPVMTTSQGPGPRVGHASLLVGNAFIVFGGDTKVDERDVLDETLYLLNTSTRQWSLARPHGHRPSGRYGHTLNILGSKLYIFGGQVDTVFFNDLVAFDLNTLQHVGSKWEVLSPTPEGTGDVPASRTNHTIITWNEKLYLFGGTNGTKWFNDVWSYDPKTNEWTQLDCIGFIPSAREGHAASLVNDVMYVFGGRSSEGTDLGDLAAFRISTRRWYTFQNMGPSPSPRSGHSMTTVGSKVIVLGGEPSVPTSSTELQMIYVLDTSKIRYPNDTPAQVSPTGQRNRIAQGPRNGSIEGGSPGPDMRPQPQKRGPRESGMAAQAPPGSNPLASNNTSGSSIAGQQGSSRLPRSSVAAQPAGPPPSQQAPAPRTNGIMQKGPVGPMGPQGSQGPQGPQGPQSRTENVSPIQPRDIVANGQRGPPMQRKVSNEGGINSVPGSRTTSQQHQNQRSIDSTGGIAEEEEVEELKEEPVQSRGPPAQQINAQPPQAQTRSQIDMRALADQPSIHESNPSSPVKANATREVRNKSASPIERGSSAAKQSEEFDKLKRTNDWYASELALARRAGYTPQTANSALLEERGNGLLPENERPFVEAMLALKGELAKVQGQIETQTSVAATRVRDIERQRDVAIQEAVYAKAKLAALGGPSRTPTPGDKGMDIDQEKMTDMSRKLAASLGNQADLSAKVGLLTQEISAEKKARHLADETASAAQTRISQLDEYRNWAGSEIEHLRAELFDAEKAYRDESQASQEAIAEAKLLRIDQTELSTKLKDSLAENSNYASSLDQLNKAMQATNSKSETMSRQLEEERLERERVERKLAQVKSEYEEKTADLQSTHQRMKDVEELMEQYAEEAKAANAVLVAGLDKIGERSDPEALSGATEDRVSVLQEQVDSTKALLTKSKQQADDTGERLAQAMQRVAGLEYQQGQSSKDSIALRRRMAEVGDEARRMKQENAELEQRLSDKQLEVDAVTAKHNALKEILMERSNQNSAVDKRRSLALASPSPSGTATPEQMNRLREMEARLEDSLRAHRETKNTAEMQAQEVEKHFRDKLEQLENDYQSAVHYVKGTEKMLKRMKDELAKLKTQNKRLQTDLEEAQSRGSTNSETRNENEADWEQERELLNHEIDDLRSKVRESATALDKQIRETKQQLDSLRDERDQLKLAHNQLQLQILDDSEQISDAKFLVERLENENSALETRAHSAEQKVSMLLDQVENSVDNYRRSARVEGANGVEPQSARSSYYDGPDNRNSVALDSLATELDALRNHWQSTNKTYRLSSTFDFEKPALSPAQPEFPSSIAQWREKLHQEEAAASSRDTSRQGMNSPTTPTLASHMEQRNGAHSQQHPNQL